MDEFTAVSRARETYALFAQALEQGRGILMRAGIVEEPPPVPEFDSVYRRLSPELKRDLFEMLAAIDAPTAVDALRIWQPLLKRAFGSPRAR